MSFDSNISLVNDQFLLELVRTHQNDNDTNIRIKNVQLVRKCDLFELLYFLDYFIHSNEYRNLVALNLLYRQLDTAPHVYVHFVISKYNPIPVDRAWSARIIKLVLWRMELEESLSWLSTLGGAFSCLGDRNLYFAKQAGETSLKQLRLSCWSGDPNLIARCFIFICHSLCQQGYRRVVIRFVRRMVYPYLVTHANQCDRVVKAMYKALCFRIQFVYKFIKPT